MKVIDKRTKKNNENYKYGDILMCWRNNQDDYDLYRISNYREKIMANDKYIAVLIHDSNSNEATNWPGSFDIPELLIQNLRKYYNHVEKVNAYIVITD